MAKKKPSAKKPAKKKAVKKKTMKITNSLKSSKQTNSKISPKSTSTRRLRTFADPLEVYAPLVIDNGDGKIIMLDTDPLTSSPASNWDNPVLVSVVVYKDNSTPPKYFAEAACWSKYASQISLDFDPQTDELEVDLNSDSTLMHRKHTQAGTFQIVPNTSTTNDLTVQLYKNGTKITRQTHTIAYGNISPFI